MAVHHRRPGGGAHRQGPALLLAALWEAGGRGGQEERRPEVHALAHHRQLGGDRLLRGAQGELPLVAAAIVHRFRGEVREVTACVCFVGGDGPAAEDLHVSDLSDPSDPAQASLVHHVGTVPHEVRLERVRPGDGRRAHHHRHRILQIWSVHTHPRTLSQREVNLLLDL